MNIQWNKTTPFSLITAIILFIAVFALGFYLGQKWGTAKAILELNQEFNEEYVPINDNGNVENNYIYATFTCKNNKIIYATFFNDNVQLYLNDDRDFLLSQTISASGARYATEDESFVFWNKGNTAFIEEDGLITYENCIEETY